LRQFWRYSSIFGLHCLTELKRRFDVRAVLFALVLAILGAQMAGVKGANWTRESRAAFGSWGYAHVDLADSGCREPAYLGIKDAVRVFLFWRLCGGVNSVILAKNSTSAPSVVSPASLDNACIVIGLLYLIAL
jgi:hypothetical protein